MIRAAATGQAHANGWQPQVRKSDNRCMMNRRHKPMPWIAAYGAIWLAAIAGPVAADGSPAHQTAQPALPVARTIDLSINGFNYTDYYIDHFTVNGNGGGNVFLSTPTAGGGGTSCCITYYPGRSLPFKVKVGWTANPCTYFKTNSDNEVFEKTRWQWKEKEVMVHGPVPAEPQHFEVHFYPDGRIEAAITDRDSPPRLRLDEDSPSRLKAKAKGYPKCSHEKQGAPAQAGQGQPGSQRGRGRSGRVANDR
jgi:hypothetical protein